MGGFPLHLPPPHPTWVVVVGQLDFWKGVPSIFQCEVLINLDSPLTAKLPPQAQPQGVHRCWPLPSPWVVKTTTSAAEVHIVYMRIPSMSVFVDLLGEVNGDRGCKG